MNRADIKNKPVRKLLFLGSVIAILIAISPYTFYLYEVFPKTKIWELPFLTLKVSNYSSWYSAAWYIANKLIPLYLLLLWFLTCRHWWYHAILIPISMYAFQLIALINEDIRYVEEMHFYHFLSIMPFIISIAYLFRVKLFNPVMKGIDLKTFNIEKSKEQRTIKLLKKVTFAEILIAFLISMSPYIFYLYRAFPDSNIWKLSFVTLKVSNYNNLYSAVWYFVNKFVPLYLLLLWLLTCRHWWKYIILIPITLYIFQLFTILNTSIKYVDEMEIYWLVPIILVTTAVVYTLRLKLFYRVVRGIDLEKLDDELKSYDTNKK